jgi:hypothetical protein
MHLSLVIFRPAYKSVLLISRRACVLCCYDLRLSNVCRLDRSANSICYWLHFNRTVALKSFFLDRFGDVRVVGESVLLNARDPVHNVTAPRMNTFQLAPLSLICSGLESPVDLGMQARA